MCEDCKSRYELNPLRILDCKVPEDQEIVKDAPSIGNYLTEASKLRFEDVQDALSALHIPYEIDEGLVRGLDYYSETVFEFHYKSKTGQDYGAVGAGGHYGKLMMELGGPELPGVGFSFGIERIVSVLKDDGLLVDKNNELDCYIMPLGESERLFAEEVAVLLRNSGGYRVDMCFDKTKVGNMFKRASNKGAKFAVIVGEEEAKNDSVVLKNLATQEQETVKLENIIDKLDEFFGSQEEETQK